VTNIAAPVSEDDLVRLVSIRQLQAPSALPGVDLDALTRSIRAHGVLHPLFIRENDGGYEIISGRRRYAACVVTERARRLGSRAPSARKNAPPMSPDSTVTANHRSPIVTAIESSMSRRVRK